MLRLATDEDFNNRIVRGLLRRQPDLDVMRVQDAGLAGKSDEDVLVWAASEGRILELKLKEIILELDSLSGTKIADKAFTQHPLVSLWTYLVNHLSLYSRTNSK